MVKLLHVIALITIILASAWFFIEPGFEPVITAVGAICIFIGERVVHKGKHDFEKIFLIFGVSIFILTLIVTSISLISSRNNNINTPIIKKSTTTPSQDQNENITPTAFDSPEVIIIPSTYSPNRRDPSRLAIGSISLNRPIYPVDINEKKELVSPKTQPGWYLRSARPGEGNNIIIFARVFRFRDYPSIPAPFANLQELDIGDEISVFSVRGDEYKYEVTSKIAAEQEDIQYMLPSEEEKLTLIGAIGDTIKYPNGEIDRSKSLVIIAELEK